MNTIGFSHPSPGPDARQSDAPQQHASAEQADVVAHLPRTGDTEHRDLAHGFRLADRLVQPAEGSIARPDGENVFVEPKVMEVLLHLARAQGHLVTRRELLDEFWYPDAECDGALTRTVCTLRRDLGDSCRSPRFIHTVHGRGYRLLVPVEPVSPDSQPDGEPRNGVDHEDQTSGEASPPAARPTLFAELKRRRVFRVASAYLVVGWLTVQIAETTFEPLGAPDWCLTVLVLAVILGFPLAVVLAWAVQLTSRGAVLEMPVAELSDSESGVARSGFRYLLLTALLFVIGLLGYELAATEDPFVSAASECDLEEIATATSDSQPIPVSSNNVPAPPQNTVTALDSGPTDADAGGER